ncbi:unnamed protein product [Brachionus calyciflorus]|uniref:mannosyl-oligosaccharide 1,3-1,6-alpha-mannosidase n=1 Tax=Brachionus calyciflorus TaxID=104777 RepID=A0A814CM86_9BILA|nr:unnamed protein product [Brachionus calyciflorus]
MTYTLNSYNTIDDSDLIMDREEIQALKQKIKTLEQKALVNEKNLLELEAIYKNINQDRTIQVHKVPNITQNNYQGQCQFFKELTPKNTDFQISELFEKLPFDDIDGGVWKQGFEITYDQNQWSQEKKLNVIIVPHSHNDPGWILTFEEYFQQRTKNILDTIVNTLIEKSTRKFIWAETSYLSLWWTQASEDMKSKMKKLIVETKQLEIVTGGWVMNDEANSYYYAMIEQMIEGHEWLRNKIDASIRPEYGWAIDPFGYTPTMPYLLEKMGFKSMLIQRVHYHVKKYLAQNQKLEFLWKQDWSKENSIFCHVMPFYSYDIPHTCGPDPKICCQFDFARASGQYSCPWGVQPQVINARNVDERSRLLLDQYRKKSQLYGDKKSHNVLLVVLGDDFRYQSMNEAKMQFENYEKLMDYMNSKAEFNVNIKWGTLKDYFELVKENDLKENIQVPSFSGDFFTYADRQDHYWSGYFTSRAFYKRLDRVVEGYLRTAEIFYSLNNLNGKDNGEKMNNLYKELLGARRNLGLFQHHDGITGTSKSHVVLDYSNK